MRLIWAGVAVLAAIGLIAALFFASYWLAFACAVWVVMAVGLAGSAREEWHVRQNDKALGP